MIVDITTFNITPPSSSKKILCSCDSCGISRHVRKSDLTRQGGCYTMCRSCRNKTRQRASGYRPLEGRTKYHKNDKFFERPNLLNSYWAGFIAADGHLNTKNKLSFGLSTVDKTILERFVRDTEYTGILRDSFYDGKARTNLVVCSCRKWFGDLSNNYAVSGTDKTITLMPPENLDLDNALAYVIGYIDGDGCIHKTKKGLVILNIVGTEELLKWIKTQFEKISAETSVIRILKFKHARCHQLQVRGKRAKAILALLRDLPIEKLERKWGKVIWGTI